MSPGHAVNAENVIVRLPVSWGTKHIIQNHPYPSSRVRYTSLLNQAHDLSKKVGSVVEFSEIPIQSSEKAKPHQSCLFKRTLYHLPSSTKVRCLSLYHTKKYSGPISKLFAKLIRKDWMSAKAESPMLELLSTKNATSRH